jgi:hypothetical protein
MTPIEFEKFCRHKNLKVVKKILDSSTKISIIVKNELNEITSESLECKGDLIFGFEK